MQVLFSKPCFQREFSKPWCKSISGQISKQTSDMKQILVFSYRLQHILFQKVALSLFADSFWNTVFPVGLEQHLTHFSLWPDFVGNELYQANLNTFYSFWHIPLRWNVLGLFAGTVLKAVFLARVEKDFCLWSNFERNFCHHVSFSVFFLSFYRFQHILLQNSGFGLFPYTFFKIVFSAHVEHHLRDYSLWPVFRRKNQVSSKF